MEEKIVRNPKKIKPMKTEPKNNKLVSEDLAHRVSDELVQAEAKEDVKEDAKESKDNSPLRMDIWKPLTITLGLGLLYTVWQLRSRQLKPITISPPALPESSQILPPIATVKTRKF